MPHPATPFKIRNVKVRVVVPNPAGGWFDDMSVLDNLSYGRDAVVGKEEEADIWRLCGTLGLHDGIFNSTNGRLPMLQVSHAPASPVRCCHWRPPHACASPVSLNPPSPPPSIVRTPCPCLHPTFAFLNPPESAVTLNTMITTCTILATFVVQIFAFLNPLEYAVIGLIRALLAEPDVILIGDVGPINKATRARLSSVLSAYASGATIAQLSDTSQPSARENVRRTIIWMATSDEIVATPAIERVVTVSDSMVQVVAVEDYVPPEPSAKFERKRASRISQQQRAPSASNLEPPHWEREEVEFEGGDGAG